MFQKNATPLPADKYFLVEKKKKERFIHKRPRHTPAVDRSDADFRYSFGKKEDLLLHVDDWGGGGE